MEQEKDYVLGTHNEEIARLGLQHRVWRPRALDAWRRAGFTSGQTLIDIGCGPGYASIDLSEIVGSAGRVHAIDRSKRFLDALKRTSDQRGIANITRHEIDLNASPLPDLHADGIWVRWVFAFLKNPRQLLSDILRILKPNGVIVIHEYFDYSTWKVIPRTIEVEEFAREAMQSWRDEGGEPNIGLELPLWLDELGCTVKALNPIIDIVSPANFVWQWPKTFLQIGLRRLVDLGRISQSRANEIQSAFDVRDADPRSLMFTPGVLEIIAARRQD